ncbi:LOW QUALITY PROTEIN: hypothetical protein HID58_018574, partial [Brassica napus]
EELQTYLTTVPLPGISQVEDHYAWEVEGTELQSFSTSKTWNVVRNRAVEQGWTQSIWFKGHTCNSWFSLMLVLIVFTCVRKCLCPSDVDSGASVVLLNGGEFGEAKRPARLSGFSFDATPLCLHLYVRMSLHFPW